MTPPGPAISLNRRRRLHPAALAALGSVAAIALGGWASLYLPVAPAVDRPVPPTPLLLDCHGREVALLGRPDCRECLPVPLAAMGRWLPAVTVAIEDHRFYAHRGLDGRALAGAMWRNLRAGRTVGGGSTITAQLVKLANQAARAPAADQPPGRGGDRGLLTKAAELHAALRLERQRDKDWILAAYLNRLPYGNGIVGPEAAARRYFGKPAAELTLAEAVYLAGLPQAPTRFNPWRQPAAATDRYRRAVATLARRGLIAADRATRLAAAPPAVGNHPPPDAAPHFADAIRARLAVPPAAETAPAAAVAADGRLRSTLDLDLQAMAEGLVTAHLAELRRPDVTGAALVVIENRSGAVRAMVGSPDYAACQVNGALMPRNCGSTLKPFLYLLGIDRHLFTAATWLPDLPEAVRDCYPDYEPRNFNDRYLGPVRVREALGSSLNIPAVVALRRLGARTLFFALEKVGCRFARGLDSCGAGLILGNAELSLLDLSAAYAGLAQGGAIIRPRLLVADPRRTHRLASPAAAAIVTDILADNRARRHGFRVDSPLALPWRVAAKTGTSSGFRDTWTVGFNREHTVGVWVGNFDGHPLGQVASATAAAPLWAAMMRHLAGRDAPLPPLVPEAPGTPGATIVARDIRDLDGRAAREFFLAGTEPPAAETVATLPPEFAAWKNGPGKRARAVVVGAPPLRILNPRPDAEYTLIAEVPPARQCLELRTNAPDPAAVEWALEGRPLTPDPASGRCWWPLQPGVWRVAATAGGQTVEQTFRVR